MSDFTQIVNQIESGEAIEHVSPPSADMATWTCSLGPNTVANDKPLIACTDYAGERFNAALALLEVPDVEAPSEPRLLLAMVYHELKKPKEARTWFDKAVKAAHRTLPEDENGVVLLAITERMTLELRRDEATHEPTVWKGRGIEARVHRRNTSAEANSHKGRRRNGGIEPGRGVRCQPHSSPRRTSIAGGLSARLR